MKAELRQLKNKYKINLSDTTFIYAINVELEHGSKFGKLTNITNDSLDTTARIVLAHISEFPDYHQRLKKMESEADKYWKKRKTSRRTTKKNKNKKRNTRKQK